MAPLTVFITMLFSITTMNDGAYMAGLYITISHQWVSKSYFVGRLNVS